MSTCILINTTTKYLSIVNVQLTCIRRYAPILLQYPIFVASDADSKFHLFDFPVDVVKIPLLPEESGFIESRIAAIQYIQDGDPMLQNILMLQDDFWIDRSIREEEWRAALMYMEDPKVKSVRLMPCPGPNANVSVKYEPFAEITEADTYRFTFQATVWKAPEIVKFLQAVLESAIDEFGRLHLAKTQWNIFCVRYNVAENTMGQDIFKRVSMNDGSIHLAIPRRGGHPAAVNLATVPYRPTAVVKGRLESWAKEFAIREGFSHLEGWY